MAKSNNGNKGKKPAPATLSDLFLTVSPDGTVTTTISPNAQWAGIQKFVDMSTNDGAISVGNWNYNTPPGPGTTKSVASVGTGYYRGWSSDFDATVHLSNVVFIP